MRTVTLLVSFTGFLATEREIPDLQAKLGSLRRMVKLVTRAHTHTELRDEEEAGTVEQVRLATGLMNHSCDPLIVNSSRGRQLTKRALRPLEAGVEVPNCYGLHHR